MEEYINNYDTYNKKVIYNFQAGEGGIGDCIKFFMVTLNYCINYKYKIYYLKNNIPIEKYLKLKYSKMYINRNEAKNINSISNEHSIKIIQNTDYNILLPCIFYNSFNYNSINIKIEDVFEFSNEVIINSQKLLFNPSYISIHLRLGDKYLETDKSFIIVKNDQRRYNEEKIYEFIEKNYNKNIFFFCDNKSYKNKIKNKYDKIIITDWDIGHTGLLNTNDIQTLNTITEFYLMTNSEQIYSASPSGFSVMAAKFKNIPIIYSPE
jgi:hypothetical protein